MASYHHYNSLQGNNHSNPVKEKYTSIKIVIPLESSLQVIKIASKTKNKSLYRLRF